MTSYERHHAPGYRMPVHFGPSLGPRQGPDGRRYTNSDAPDTVALTVTFASDPELLATLMPQQFSPADNALVTVRASSITNIPWLAGRGYSTFGVSAGSRYSGDETVDGEFLFVLWENLSDAIITGRDELGYNKVFADIEGPVAESGNTVTYSASWMGHRFAKLAGRSLVDVEPPANAAQAPYLHFKYIPRTGAWGKADVAYPTITPRTGENVRVTKLQVGEGSVDWTPGNWEDLPTLHPIVVALASLPVLGIPRASFSRMVGAQDLYETRRLR